MKGKKMKHTFLILAVTFGLAACSSIPEDTTTPRGQLFKINNQKAGSTVIYEVQPVERDIRK
jgi:starvation-inducible outer membrane lipoprotein